MSFGFSYDDSFHMAPRDYRRYAGIFSSWSISADNREEGVRKAEQADINAIFG